MAHFCEQVVELEHQQMGFILLRQCCGSCRVVRLLRALDTKESHTLVEAVDRCIMDSTLAMLRAPCSDVARTQLMLPLRLAAVELQGQATLPLWGHLQPN